MPGQVHKLDAPTGETVKVQHVEPVDETTARFDLWIDDGPQFRVEVTDTGDVDVLTRRDADGQLAAIDFPEWADYATAKIGRRR